MTRRRRKQRMRFEAVVAFCGAAATAAALIGPQWIERLFGASPDGGSGETEWFIPVLCFLAAAAASWAALHDGSVLRRRADVPDSA